MMTKDGLIFEANSLKQGRLQALTRQQLQAQATQNRERRWVVPTVPVATVLPSHAPRSASHVVTSGVRSCAAPSPRWLLPETDRRIAKETTRPNYADWSSPLYYVTGWTIPADKSIRSLRSPPPDC